MNLPRDTGGQAARDGPAGTGETAGAAGAPGDPRLPGAVAPDADPDLDVAIDPIAVPPAIAAHAAVEASELLAEISAATEAELRAQRLELFAFDVDGVLTDGTLWIGDHGEVFKGFSVHDGYGLVLLARAGCKLAIVTGRRSEIVQRRAEELGIDLVLQGVPDKAQGLLEACARLQVPVEHAGYMGDDWPDLPALHAAGFAATVAQAPEPLREAAHWVASAAPGRGAVRELCEWLLRARGRWPPQP